MGTTGTKTSLQAALVLRLQGTKNDAAAARRRAQIACARARLVLARSNEVRLVTRTVAVAPTEGCANCDDLRAALATRDLIWTAKVLIAAATGQGPDEVHQLLVQQSQAEQIKLRDVAAEIVRLAEHRAEVPGGLS